MSTPSKYIQLEAIIGRIDNDFNIDNSDWIPRIGIWTIAALQLIDGLSTSRVRKEYPLRNGSLVNKSLSIHKDNIKLFTEDGCEIKKAPLGEVRPKGDNQCAVEAADDLDADYNNDYMKHVDMEFTPDTMVIHEEDNHKHIGCGGCGQGGVKNRNSSIYKYAYINGSYVTNYYGRNIIAEYDDYELEYNETYNCKFPLVPNYSVIVEYIINFCMYKLLCRGYKHPVYNLSNNPSVNPYLIYKSLLPEAKRAILNNSQNMDAASDLMRSNFYINTFNPRK